MDSFRDWQSVNATIQRNTNTLDPTTGKYTTSSTTGSTYKCIFWVGRQAERVVAEKIRTKVDAVGVFDVGIDIKIRDEVVINSVTYNVVDVDNVAFQNEALVVPLAEKA